MRKLRPGVARAYRKKLLWQEINAEWMKAISEIADNFYTDTPFQMAVKENNGRSYYDALSRF
jgi:hypothetical protein